MNSKEKYSDNKYIGDVAERLVKDLINSIPNWKCMPYGVENHIDELKQSLKTNNRSEVSKNIRSMPDFVAINEETNEVMFLDVKYRSFVNRKGRGKELIGFQYGQIKDYLKFWPSARLIMVHPCEPYLYIVKVSDIEWYKHFDSRTGEGKNLKEHYNFSNISKSIKEVFPDVSEESLKKAIERIPKRNGS